MFENDKRDKRSLISYYEVSDSYRFIGVKIVILIFDIVDLKQMDRGAKFRGNAAF